MENWLKQKPKKEQKDKLPIKGDGFITGESYDSLDHDLHLIKVPFRPGASSEQARRDKETEIKQQEDNAYANAYAMAHQEKIQRDEEWPQQNRSNIASWFKDRIDQGGGEYSETFQIKQEGSLDREKRMDGYIPYLVIEGNLKGPEDLYRLAYDISQEHPDLDISFNVDPSGKWIKYSVSKKNKK